LIKKGIFHLEHSVRIHKKYVNGYLNLGVAYFKLKDFERAEEYWAKAKAIYPNNPLLKRNFDLLAATYFNQGMSIGAKNIEKAIQLMEKAVSINPSNVEYWYNIGGACFTIKQYDKARNAWTQALNLKPDHALSQQGVAALPTQ
jgi:tetratricopeptide (TPR) repeat protein